MNYRITSARRLIAVAAAAVAGLGISSAAYAATSTSAARAAATIPACSGGVGTGISAWVAIDQGNGAAGTIYYPLEFTNTSRHTCSLYGYPGVSAISRTGQQLGSPAGRGSLSGAKRVILAPGATAHTILAYHDAAVSTSSGCHPVESTFDLRVYLPGQRVATDAAFDFDVCSHPGVVYMNIVEPITAGVGTING